MKVFALMLSLVLVVQGEDTRTAEQNQRCKAVAADFNQCTRNAHQTYAKAIKQGSDGRPDFTARKACNYLTDGVENCGSKLIGECNTAEKVMELKDKQITDILKRLNQSVKTWDSSKCPAVQAHIDRMKEEADAEAEPENSSTALVSSALLLGVALLL